MRRAVAATGLLALLAIGCSGGGGTSAASFAKQGNDLCQKLATDDASGRAALGSAPAADALTTYIQGTYVPEANETYKAIAGLPKPKDKKDDIDALITDVLAEIHIIQGDPVTGGDKVNQAALVTRLKAVGLTACGAGFASTVDKDSFVARANTFCTNLKDQIDRQLSDLNAKGPTTPEQRSSFVANVVAPLYTDALNSIEAIGYPTADATFLAGIVTDSRAYIQSFLGNTDVFFDHSNAASASISQRWHAYGATNCG